MSFKAHRSTFDTRYFLLESIWAKQVGSDAFITAPGRYRKPSEEIEEYSFKFAGRNSAMVKSCHQEAKCFNEFQTNEYQFLSVEEIPLTLASRVSGLMDPIS